MGSCPITFLWLWPETDHEAHCLYVPINKICRASNLLHVSGWSRSHMAGIYSGCSTRKIINNVCLSITSQPSWFLAWSLPSTYPMLCYKKIWVSPKSGYFPLELCPKIWTLRILPWQVDRVVNTTRRHWRWGLLTTPILYDNQRVTAVYYKSVNCNPLTALIWFVVDLLYNMFPQLTRFWLTYHVRLR